jgi:hypothetical protein
MVCPAKIFNLFNPVSIIGIGFVLYSAYSMFSGMTYVYRRGKNTFFKTYQRVYYSEEPVIFTVSVILNLIFGLVLADLINNFGFIAFCKQFLPFIP